jgi:methyl-accepting chemotaxis protein
MRAKHAIKMAEKDHQENLDRAKEIAQLGKELQESVKNQSNLDRDFLKKIDRLEKLTKKIRGEAGGEDEEVEIANRPSDLADAVKQVAESADSLSKNVQKTPRQVVSASVIGDANVLLQLIKLLRTFVRQP